MVIEIEVRFRCRSYYLRSDYLQRHLLDVLKHKWRYLPASLCLRGVLSGQQSTDGAVYAVCILDGYWFGVLL